MAKKTKFSRQKTRREIILDFIALADRFLKKCENEGLTKNTRQTYKDVVTAFLRFVEKEKGVYSLDQINREHIEDYLGLKRKKGCAGEYLNSILRNLKPFFRWLKESNIIENNPFDKIKLLKVDKKRKIPLERGQVEEILKQIPLFNYVGERDYLIIQMLFGCAFRIEECLSLKIKDINFEQGIIYVETSKNREDSYVPIPVSLEKLLKNYIQKWLKDDSRENYLFQNKYGEKLSRHTIYKNIKKYALKAGIKANCHLFRHSFAINYLLAGGSTASLRRQLRQKDLKTVEEYLHWLPQYVIDEHRRYNPLDRIRKE